jgi:putative ATPase
MSDLFDAAPVQGRVPLAAALRPEMLDDVIGQESITGPGTVLRRRIAAQSLGSLILYGPPGIGKTTIARAIGNMLGKEFRPLHATRDGVKALRALADEAKMKPLLIFVDEVHRFSATQADDLLSICEEGTADFVGATTGNPYHALPPALISRSTILQLEPISIEDMARVVERGLRHLQAQGTDVEISPENIRMIAGRSGGDARRALTTLESLTIGQSGTVQVTEAMLEEIYASAAINHDRSGDQHYDTVSAFCKSMRGSDPDATLYWLARLIHAGEDPRFIARRIMIHASEDVGLADNTALQTAVAASTAVERIGYPEARIILAHAALHVARAPKSNSAYRGIAAALAAVEGQPPVVVPKHLRDGHYAGAKELGHNVGYAFPHNDPRGWVEQDYAPGVSRGAFYQSDGRGGGSFEARADQYWEGVTGKPGPRTF